MCWRSCRPTRWWTAWLRRADSTPLGLLLWTRWIRFRNTTPELISTFVVAATCMQARSGCFLFTRLVKPHVLAATCMQARSGCFLFTRLVKPHVLAATVERLPHVVYRHIARRIQHWIKVNYWVSEWVGEWVGGWVVGWVGGWVSEWASGWVGGWLNEWRNEGMKEWRNEGMKEWRNEGMKEWRNEGMNEWMNEWMNDVFRPAATLPVPLCLDSILGHWLCVSARSKIILTSERQHLACWSWSWVTVPLFGAVIC